MFIVYGVVSVVLFLRMQHLPFTMRFAVFLIVYTHIVRMATLGMECDV